MSFTKYIKLLFILVIASHMKCKSTEVNDPTYNSTNLKLVAIFPYFQDFINFSYVYISDQNFSIGLFRDKCKKIISNLDSITSYGADSLVELAFKIEILNYNTPHILDSSLPIYNSINTLLKSSHLSIPYGLGTTYAYMQCINRDYESAEKTLVSELSFTNLESLIDSIYYFKLLILRAYTRKQQGWTFPERVSESTVLYNECWKYFYSLSNELQALLGPTIFFESANQAVHLRDTLRLKELISNYKLIYFKDIKPFNTDYLWAQYYYQLNDNNKLLHFTNKFKFNDNNIFNELTGYQFQSITYLHTQALTNNNKFKEAYKMLNFVSNTLYNSDISLIGHSHKKSPFYFILLGQLYDLYYFKYNFSKSKLDSIKLNQVFQEIDNIISTYDHTINEFILLYFNNQINNIYTKQVKHLVSNSNSKDFEKINILHSILNKHLSMSIRSKEVNSWNLSNVYKISSQYNLKYISQVIDSSTIIYEFFNINNLIIRIIIADNNYYKVDTFSLSSSLKCQIDSINIILNLKQLKYTTSEITNFKNLSYNLYSKLVRDNKIENIKKANVILNINDTLLSKFNFLALLYSPSLASDSLITWGNLHYLRLKTNIINTPSIYNYFIKKQNSINNQIYKSILFIASEKNSGLNFKDSEFNTILKYSKSKPFLLKKIDFNNLKSFNQFENFNCVHIAAHGKSNNFNIDGSKIISNLDTITYSDISKLDFRNSNILLSLCESSNGRYMIGEGTYNLIHSFLRANSQYVVGPSGEIPDYYSNLIFGEIHSFDNKEIIQDLKESINNSFKDKRFEHPAFWSKIKVYY